VTVIANRIANANPSVSADSVKLVLQDLAVQTQGKGGNVEESLTKLLEQVSQEPAGILAMSIKDRTSQQQGISSQPQEQQLSQNQEQTESVNSIDQLYDLFLKQGDLVSDTGDDTDTGDDNIDFGECRLDNGQVSCN